MVARLRTYGAHSEEVPTISVEPPRSPLQMDKAIRGLVEGRYEWIAFTSVNAVKAVREKFEEYGLDARAFSGLKVAVVGDVTATALRSWGIEPDLVPVRTSSRRPAWPPSSRRTTRCSTRSTGCSCRVPTSPPRRWPPGWSSSAGRSRTSPPTAPSGPPRRPRAVREAIKTGKFDAVVFTSSSTVRNLVGIAGKPHPGTMIAAIGPATAEDVRGARAAGRRRRRQAVGRRSGRRAGRASPPTGATSMIAAGEPVLRPSQRKPTTRAGLNDSRTRCEHRPRGARARERRREL